MAILAKMCR